MLEAFRQALPQMKREYEETQHRRKIDTDQRNHKRYCRMRPVVRKPLPDAVERESKKAFLREHQDDPMALAKALHGRTNPRVLYFETDKRKWYVHGEFYLSQLPHYERVSDLGITSQAASLVDRALHAATCHAKHTAVDIMSRQKAEAWGAQELTEAAILTYQRFNAWIGWLKRSRKLTFSEQPQTMVAGA